MHLKLDGMIEESNISNTVFPIAIEHFQVASFGVSRGFHVTLGIKLVFELGRLIMRLPVLPIPQ